MAVAEMTALLGEPGRDPSGTARGTRSGRVASSGQLDLPGMKLLGGPRSVEVLSTDSLADSEAISASVDSGENRSRDGLIEVDPTTFREVLGHIPTGVAVITTLDGDQPRGLTVGSFFSVSLEPSLVGFCVMADSRTWPAIERAGYFAVSVLAHDQADVCRRLATKAPDKFNGLSWWPAPVTGAPLLERAVAHLDCELEDKHAGGDHWIVVGRVRHLFVHRPEDGPLVFCRGLYGQFRQAELP